jgi:hypothetical protein
LIDGNRYHPNDKIVYDIHKNSVLFELERDNSSGKDFPIGRHGLPENKLSLPLAIPDEPHEGNVTIKSVYHHEDFALKPGPPRRYTLGSSVAEIEKEHGINLLKASKLQIQMFAMSQVLKQHFGHLVPKF